MRTRLLVVVLAAVCALAGCASIPTDSAPQPVQPFNRQVATSALPTPQNDMDPDALVRAFLRASADPRDAHASARAFLTSTASTQWDDRGDTVVLDDASLLVDDRTDTSVRMRLIADNSGTLKVNGQLLPANGRIEATMTLKRTSDGWRIDGALPSGVMLDRRQFESSYRLAMLYFPSVAATNSAGAVTLTADPRWFYLGNYTPTDVLTRLIAGPTPELAGAVQNSFPSDARLNGKVRSVRGEGVTADFSGLAGLTAAQRNLLAAQVIWTFNDADVAGPYTLTADGAPLLPGHAPQWRISDVESSNPSAVQHTSVGLNILRGGSLLAVTDGGATPVAGPLGTDTRLVGAAISADGTRVVAVQRSADTPALTLVAGTYGGAVSPITSGTVISRPSFAANNRTIWAVVDGKPTQWVLADGGAARVTVADSSAIGVVARGPIMQLKVSPDGSRAAMLVAGQLLFASIVTHSDGSIALSSPRIAAYNLGNNATGIAWATPTTLMIVRDSPEAPVAQISISGLPAVGLLSGNLTPPLRSVAANATTVYVADARGVLRLGSTNGQPDRSWTEVVSAMTPDALPVLPTP
ncbi:hypothetical protein HH308_03105 [Gordonia sp. TBRC 11910]|uniref:Lipoprotein LpqB n=1 Tax=Gordonia asplenii TaxID=2725283 RepID=A0A848KPF5_9ACTN|nr:LpqB family beta-propeller domain-containing protein [Gordonia asplenii]NMO00200.1 hypothetical protein [Gordonia asplenii]